MKSAIHPEYHPEAKISCVCGNVRVVGSTQKAIAVELCSSCHPFFTGKQKLVDTARRVEKFQDRTAKKEAASATQGGKKRKVAKRVARRDAARATAEKETSEA